MIASWHFCFIPDIHNSDDEDKGEYPGRVHESKFDTSWTEGLVHTWYTFET